MTARTVGVPLRSSSALVATVVPILTASITASGSGSPLPRSSRSRMPWIAASRYCSGFSDNSLWMRIEPSGARPTTSVNVPPLSIQNCQPECMTRHLLRCAMGLYSQRVGPGLPRTQRCRRRSFAMQWVGLGRLGPSSTEAHAREAGSPSEVPHAQAPDRGGSRSRCSRSLRSRASCSSRRRCRNGRSSEAPRWQPAGRSRSASRSGCARGLR